MARDVTLFSAEGELPSWQEDIGTSVITIHTVRERPPAYLKRDCSDGGIAMAAEIELWLEKVEGGTRINAFNRTWVTGGTMQSRMIRLTLRLTDTLEEGLRSYFRRVGKTLDAEPRFHARPGPVPASP